MHTGDALITTNYDILLDNALYERRSCQYGVRIRKSIFPLPTGGKVGDYSSDRLNNRQITLLKLHGSLNWMYCRRCDELDLAPK